MGQRQLLCFARALVRVLASTVDLMLLDEAFSTVDLDGAARLRKVLLSSTWSAARLKGSVGQRSNKSNF